MFKAFRIAVLLLVLFFVSVSTWLTEARSTDWNDSLWVKVYPINADGSSNARDYIEDLDVDEFRGIEEFIASEATKYGRAIRRPVRIELGREISEQPPLLAASPGRFDIMLWSLKMRLWASDITGDQDNPDPDVRIFVRYHAPREAFVLENSVGLQKGMVGVVNAFASRGHAGTNNVIIAHEFLHTLGATDKYDLTTGLPRFPDGYAEPGREPRFPQRYAEIMGGRIAITEADAVIPDGLGDAVIGIETAREIRLAD